GSSLVGLLTGFGDSAGTTGLEGGSAKAFGMGLGGAGAWLETTGLGGAASTRDTEVSTTGGSDCRKKGPDA
ncbi:MAG: hypothetical protein ACO3FW_00400, partial [Burkholderiaceae bacterium]